MLFHLSMLLLYTHTITPRLQYITDFISKELFDAPVTITTDKQAFAAFSGPRVNYSDTDFSEQEFFIRAHSLLFETVIQPQTISVFEVNFNKAFFQTSGDFPFDVFAAAFYLLSRYEEYLPHTKDMFGRYAHENSLAVREQFLHLPLVNYWLADFKKALQQKFPALSFKRNQFKFIPTYDIDIAYSYKNKGWLRNLGGAGRSLLKGDWTSLKDRMDVLQDKKKDPFDAYEWLDALHLYCRVKPVYFFLVAQKQQGFDKNIPTSSRALQQLIAYFANVHKLGLHPSWQSSVAPTPTILKEEKEWLEAVADKVIIHSRQHYIKFDLPLTYRRLAACGITRDYSMGYGSINGFRASVASSFAWFDLEKNEPTSLMLFPFCFMDANAYYEQKRSPKEAYDELKQYYTTVKKLNGLLITVWHNNFLGTEPAFTDWKEMYSLFMKEDIYWDAYNN
jgi:hypothetical protein